MSGFAKPNWALWLEPGERTLWEGAPVRPSPRRTALWLVYWAAVFVVGIAVGVVGAGTGWLILDLALWALVLYAPVGAGLVILAALSPKAGLLTDRRALAAERRLGRWRIVGRRSLGAATGVRLEGTRVTLGEVSGVTLEAGSEAEAARLAGLAESALKREGAA
jgi:hypothetical protein